MNRSSLGLAVLFLSASLAGIAAPKTTHKMAMKSKKPAMMTMYKAHCGMMYSAAEAKKNHYICPMDHKSLTKVMVPVKMTKPAMKMDKMDKKAGKM
jgi:hypothetical protein